MLLVGLVISGGCVGPATVDGIELIPPVLIGAKATYDVASSTGRAMLDVSVGPIAEVTDARGERARAVLVYRWLNSTGPIPTISLVDAVDPESGALRWTALLCAERDSSGGCADKVAFFFNMDGTPGLVGRAWLSFAAAGRAKIEDAGPSCFRIEAGPTTLLEGVPLQRRHFPPGLPEGEGMVFCESSAFPISLTSISHARYTLRSSSPGSGDAIAVTYSAPGSSGRPHPDAVAWDRRVPPGPEWQQRFPLHEAWQWLSESSSDFRSFERENPDLYLRYSQLVGASRSSTRDIPVVGVQNYSERIRRLVDVEAPSGEGLSLELEKSWAASGLAPRIEQVSATPMKQGPSLISGSTPDRLLPLATGTRRVLDRVQGEWEDTHVLADGAYYYRVLVRPPHEGAPPAGTRSYLPFTGILRADSGEFVYAYGPLHVGMPPAS